MSVKDYIGGQFSNPHGIGGTFSTLAMNILNSEHYRAVNKYIDKDAGSKVLDIGFGNGYMIKKLSRNQGLKLYGIDVSYDMLQAARNRNIDGVTLNKIMLCQASVTELPYNDSFFDSVYTINTLYFWGDYEKAFGEILRVLKSGGKFICTFYCDKWLDKLPYCDNGFKKFTPRQAGAKAKKYGFNNVKIKILQKDKSYCLIGEKP